MESVTLEILSASTTRAPSPWSLPCVTNIQRLYYIKGGKGYIIQEDGSKEPFQKGSIYIFSHNLKQQFVADADDPMDHIYFDFISTPPIIAPQPLIYPIRAGSHVANLVVFLDNLMKENLELSDVSENILQQRERILCSGLEILLRLLSEERSIPFSNDAAISRVLVFIHENYRNNLSVEILATEAGFAPNSFIRRFKQIMGQPPYAYVKEYRLMKACELLSKGVTVAQAAEQVGYENGSSLSRALADRRTVSADWR